MILINKLATPGSIRRVELGVETVVITLHDRKDRLYKLVSPIDGRLLPKTG